MNAALWSAIEAHLEQAGVDGDIRDLVEGACLDALDAVLEGHDRAGIEAKAGAQALKGVRGGFLSAIEVEGFRGIGPRARLDLEPGPGLTLVVGRNGSGKSSFVDALEVLLTGTSTRWEGRTTSDWALGWANLGHPETKPVLIAAEFVIESAGAVKVSHTWPADDRERKGGQRRTEGVADFDALGWRQAIDVARPILSYTELGRLPESRPTDLHDQLSGLLGLEAITAAQDRLKAARKAFEDTKKRAKAAREALASMLQSSDDERAAPGLEALSGRRPDLEALESLALGVEAEGAGGEQVRIAALASLAAPTSDEVEAATAALRASQEGVDTLANSTLHSQDKLADLLAAALEYVQRSDDGECPVCGTPDVLGASWQADAGCVLVPGGARPAGVGGARGVWHPRAHSGDPTRWSRRTRAADGGRRALGGMARGARSPGTGRARAAHRGHPRAAGRRG
jgi:energy-coupling factor transporter ATP-binding protein EcfA2